ncbi:MAG: hypothetical protein ABIP94_07600 [Planctomycetota bacterium]
MKVAPHVRLWARVALVTACAAAVLGLVHGLVEAPDATNRLRDDAFYEFAWAANVAAGRGPMVSDGITTSGVQWLWSMLLVPVVWLFGAGALPLVAPWLGFGLHTLAAALLWLGARDRWAGACLGLCWLGNPLLVRESQNGQETALACLCLLLLWFARQGSRRAFGCWSVLTVLARSDLFAAVFALSCCRHRSLRWRAWLAPLLALAVLTLANVLFGGGLLPDSAAPMAWLWHNNHAALDPNWAGWLERSWWFLRPVLLGGPFAQASAFGMGLLVFAIVRPFWPASLRALPALSVGCACACDVHDLATAGWTALLLALLPAEGRRRLPTPLVALFVGLLAVVALHWALRWYPRDYYVAPFVVGASAAALHFARCRLVLVAFAVAQIVDLPRVRPEPLAGQQEMVMAGRFLDQVLPTVEKVGCFNSGLVTFYASVLAPPQARRAIVNLDGVVNARAFAALQRGELAAYLDAEGVRFVLDNPVQFALDPRLPHASGLWFGSGFEPQRDLVEVARFDVPFVDSGRASCDSMRLYWRRGHGEAPVRAPAAEDLGPGPGGSRVVLWPAQAGSELQAEQAHGRRVPIVSVDVDTVVIVSIAPTLFGTGRFFESGAVAPVLVLRQL